MHGWSKDDIFDMFEALGFGKMTKENYILEVITLDPSITIRQLIKFDAYVTSGDLFSLDFSGTDTFNISFTSNTPIDASQLRIYYYLCKQAYNQQDPLNLIHTEGTVWPPNPFDADPISGEGAVRFLFFDLFTFGCYANSFLPLLRLSFLIRNIECL